MLSQYVRGLLLQSGQEIKTSQLGAAWYSNINALTREAWVHPKLPFLERLIGRGLFLVSELTDF